MCIAFACCTTYHVFVSYILKKTYYKEQPCILIIPNNLRKFESIFNSSLNIDVWENVYMLDEISNDKIKLENDILKIFNENDIKVLHYFSWGCLYSRLFFSYCYKQKIKMILTDEGLLTYSPFYLYIEWEKNNEVENKDIDLENIEEIWLFEPDCYIDKTIKPIKKIDINLFFKNNKINDIILELNKIFDYKDEQYNFNSGIIFLDQYFENNRKNCEIFFLEKVNDIFKKYKNVYVKKHPSESIIKYSGLNFNIIKDDDIPWEIILLNQIKNKRIINNIKLISYHSTATFSSFFFYNAFFKNAKIILLYRLFDNVFNFQSDEKLIYLNKFINKFKNKYKKSIFIPNTFYELDLILGSDKQNNILTRVFILFQKLINKNKYIQIEKAESINIMYSYSQNTLKFFKCDENSLLTSIYLDTGNNYNEKERIIDKINIKEKINTVTFFIKNSKQKIYSIRFDPIENYFCKVKIIEWFYINSENDKVYINKERIQYNTNIYQYDFYIFNTIDPMINCEINDCVKQITIVFKIEILSHFDINKLLIK